MDFLLFLFLAFLVFGAGFIIAGLQIIFVVALFAGLFGGAVLLFFLIGLSLSPLLFLFGLFFIAWLINRNTRTPQIAPPRPEK